METTSLAMLETANSTETPLEDAEKYLLETTQRSVPEPTMVSNGTGFFIDEDAAVGLNDLETFFLSCVITILPLFVAVLVAFAIRLIWRKYKVRRDESACDDDDFLKEENSDSVTRPLHSHLMNNEKEKCDDTHVSIATGVEEEATEDSTTNTSSHQSFRNNHANTNGSIITMTLKNNHLIVEKEERSDLEEDSRETIMKYSPDTRDGIFVVEVQQGVRRSPSSAETNCCDEQTVPDQCAVVHNPPERCEMENHSQQIPIDEDLLSPTSSHHPRTGLCQSDQSLTSDFHQSYCYSNQQGYDNGCYGYPTYNGYTNEEFLTTNAEALKRIDINSTKPKITSALYKNRKDATFDFDPTTDGPLLSDVQAKQKRLDACKVMNDVNDLVHVVPNVQKFVKRQQTHVCEELDLIERNNKEYEMLRTEC